MQDLREHEIFEIEVLDTLGRAGFLRPLVFGGGTMLRLCHDFPRYSVDLDFWFGKKTDDKKFYTKLRNFLNEKYHLTDDKNKRFTILFEFRSREHPRRLKIELRKEIVKEGIVEAIAYSKFGLKQVLVQTLSLEATAKRKLLAVRTRAEIRDFFDLDFLLRKGMKIDFTDEDKAVIRKKIASLKKPDFQVTLGSLLEAELRQYYVQRGFAYLLERL